MSSTRLTFAWKGFSMTNIKNIQGQKFRRLTVVSRNGSNSSGLATWNVICLCGEERIVAGAELRAGRSKSCGCGASELAQERLTRHGLSRSRTYKIWAGMIDRCSTESNRESKKYYADRGIGVCDRWRLFELFFLDMGHAPENMSIDRIDNDKGYSPANCRWATAIEQANNTRANRTFVYCGEQLTVAQWARRTGQSQNTLRARLRRGWQIDKVLTGWRGLAEKPE